jgi:hypothetical protein
MGRARRMGVVNSNRYTMKAHATTYSASNFRSRLEARWAAFFDICGWAWDYEPFDLAGWVPDFLLKGACPVLVEVKPLLLNHKKDEDNDAAVFDVIEKMTKPFSKSEPSEYDLLLLGIGPFLSAWQCDDGSEGASIGILLDRALSLNSGEHVFGSGGCALDDKCPGDHKGRRGIDFCSDTNSFVHRMCGSYSGHFSTMSLRDAEKLWREAGNRVQWKPRD